MRFLIIALLFVCQTLNGISVFCNEQVDRSDHYECYRCDNAEMENVLKANVSNEELIYSNSSIMCALSCSANTDCSYAVFNNSAKTCKIINYATSNLDASISDILTSEQKCKILKKVGFNERVPCQNGGRYITSYACDCPKEYTGRYCELSNPNFCQSGASTVVTETDRALYHSSNVPLKVVLDDTLILTVNTYTYKKTTSGHFLQANNFLDMVDSSSATSSAFAIPFRMTFVLHDLNYGTTETAKVRLDGSANTTYELTNNTTAVLLVPQNTHGFSVVFDSIYGTGSINDAIEELSQGYRKLERELLKIAFRGNNGYVTLRNILSRLLVLEPTSSLPVYWKTPLQYETFVESTGSPRYVTAYNVLDVTNSPTSIPRSSDQLWEMDQCWTKINPTVDYDEFTLILQKYVEAGFDFRVVIREAHMSQSSDVVEIQATGSDVIAQLPGTLKDGTNFKQSVISRTKTFAECGTEFQKGDVTSSKLDSTDAEIEWFVSSKNWILAYSVNMTGGVMGGDEGELFKAAKDEGKSVRVCIHYRNSSLFVVCHASASMMLTNYNGLLFQTQPSFALVYDQNGIVGDNDDGEVGEFRDIKDSDCRQYVKIVSTKGRVEEATLVLQSANSDVKDIDFERIDWFVDF